MHHKAEHLHIRATPQEKATLFQAARAKNMTVSQFMLQTSMPIAEEIVGEDGGAVDTLFRLDARDWEAFCRFLDAPARDIPELRKLLHSQAPWER